MSLHTAVQKNNIEEVRNLLQKEGADVNARDLQGNTPLHFVRDATIASLLIDACADPNPQNKDGDTPLHTWHRVYLEQTGLQSLEDLYAPAYKLQIISLLLESGASPNIQNSFGYNSLHSLFVYGGIAGLDFDAQFMNRFISLFLQFNVDVNMEDFEGCTPLHHAVKEPHVHNAETLITAGALVDARDYRGLTPLQHLFYSDNTEMAQLLLNHKANINAQGMDGRSALSTAVEVGNLEMVQLLLQDPQVCVNLADKNQVTSLHLAAAFKRVDVTEMLIQASADLNARDTLKATPLHYAAYGGTPEIVAMLLEAGADDKAKDDAGWLAVQYALSRHYYHTALPFGEEYLRDVTTTAGKVMKVAGNSIDDIIVQNLPADDIFTMVFPASKVYSQPFDFSITLDDDLVEYAKAKSAGHFSSYLQDMSTVPGVGRIPVNIPKVSNVKPEADNGNMGLEVENAKAEANIIEPEVGFRMSEVGNVRAEVESIRHNIEKFMFRWTEKIAEIDERFAGTLLQSGSVYEGTKVGDPDEFDFMLRLEKLAPTCLITFDEVTEYDKVIVYKKVGDLENGYGEFFDKQQLESGKVMRVFVDVAKKALTKLDYKSIPNEVYIEGLTEHTLIEDTCVLHGTVTCNLKFKWTGLYYKQVVITADLVPAIPVRQWPHIARQESHLLTDDIRSRGCLLVPKAGYWRLSFSLAEQLIMQRLSWEQKSAFVGAKVILHPAVSCKVVVYDDSEENCATCDNGSQSIDVCDVDDQNETDDCGVEGMSNKMHSDKEVSSFTNEGDSASFSVESGGSSNEISSLPATFIGRAVLAQSGDAVTILKMADAQNWQMLQDRMQNNPERRVNVAIDLNQEKELDTDDNSDMYTKTLLPFHVLSTYLLKNLFFNCIEQNAKDATGSIVTTKQLFTNLFHSLKENQGIPYFFMPTQRFCGLDILNDDVRCDMVLVTGIINSLLNDV